MSLSRFTDRATARADDRLEQEILRDAIGQWGPVVEVLAVDKDNEVAVEHGLGRVPDGVVVLLQVGGAVMAVRPEDWTATTAFVAASADNTRARLTFVAVRGEIVNG